MYNIDFAKVLGTIGQHSVLHCSELSSVVIVQWLYNRLHSGSIGPLADSVGDSYEGPPQAVYYSFLANDLSIIGQHFVSNCMQ